MKRRTKRKLKRFLETPLAIIGAVFTVSAILLLPLLPRVTGWTWLSLLSGLSLIGLGLVELYLKAYRPENDYFREVKGFGQLTEDTIRKGVEGILSFRKAEPFYVHVAPEFSEISALFAELKRGGFTAILGNPGEGKSMAGYQAAYGLLQREGYRIYSLETSDLEGKLLKDVQDALLVQLDRGLRGKNRLILIDDAHKLNNPREFRRVFEKEAQENNGRYIWIENESEDTKIDASGTIRISFSDFLVTLLTHFYEKPHLQAMLTDRIEGLEEAKEMAQQGAIIDVWHFAFCAARGWEKLSGVIRELDPIKLVTLFIISAHSVLSGEAELHEKTIVNNIRGLRLWWLSEHSPQISVAQAIRELEVEKLIRTYAKKQDRRYVRSLHYNFAKQVIRVSVSSREPYVEDMLSLAKTLLTQQYELCTYYASFHADIREYASQFDRDNVSWLIGFLNEPMSDHPVSFWGTLSCIRKADKDIFNEVVNRLNWPTIAARLSTVQSDQLEGLALSLYALGDRKVSLIDQLDFDQLGKTATDVTIKEFQQLARFLETLGDQRFQFIDELDFDQLGKTATDVTTKEFNQLANLLNALDRRKEELLGRLDFVKLTRRAESCANEGFQQFASLLDALRRRRKEFLDKLDLDRVAKSASNTQCNEFQGLDDLLSALRHRKEEFLDKLDLDRVAKSASNAQCNEFRQLAGLLNALDRRKEELLGKLDFDKLAHTTSLVKLKDFQQLGELFSALPHQFRQFLLEKAMANQKGTGVFVRTLSDTPISAFQALARLISGFRSKRVASIVLMHLDHDKLIQQANQAGSNDISGLVQLMDCIGKRNRDGYIKGINWANLCTKCPINFKLLGVLAKCIEKLCKKCDMLSVEDDLVAVTEYIQSCKERILQTVEDCFNRAFADGPRYYRLYREVGSLLGSWNHLDQSSASEMAALVIDKLIEQFWFAPMNCSCIAKLVTVFHAIDPELSASFLRNEKVRGRIQRSINDDDWNGKEKDLRYLVIAFYRSVPSLWRKMVDYRWIAKDLGFLDLDSIYEIVEAENLS